MNGELAQHLRLLAILMLVTGAVAGCGRKGSLEPPPKADIAHTQGGPAAAADAENQATAEADQQPSPAPGGLAGLRAKKPPPVLPPKQPFFLDPILQ